MHDRYVTDILKMCMKKINAEKNIFLTNLQGFDLHSAGDGGYTVSLACTQFLVVSFFVNIPHSLWVSRVVELVKEFTSPAFLCIFFCFF